MKLFLDFFPIVLFFVVFKAYGIYAATSIAIAATVLQIAWMRYKNGKVDTMQWVSLGVIVVFGGATLVTQDETFIKWKPSVLYWLMSVTLWAGYFIFKRNFIQSLMGAQIELPQDIWGRLLHAWAFFFTLMGFINLWVAYNFDTDTWVSYKLFGGLGLMLVFVLLQGVFLSRYMKEPEETP
jgi:intracellular septation protein